MEQEVPSSIGEAVEEGVAESEPEVEAAELQELAGVSEPMTDMWDAPDSWGADMFEDMEDSGEIFGMTATVEEELHIIAPIEPVEDSTAMEPAAPETLEEAIAQADEAITGEEEPEPPPEAEAPRGITIREFFATLGSRRPPTVNGEDAFTAHEEAARQEQPQIEEQESKAPYPYADDAFASLFQDAPVSPEDSRAAAALSSAVAHKPPSAVVTTPSESRALPAQGAAQTADTMQESEEDIRRFREWLDGLANS
jgi:hypothetical protein